MRMERQLNTMIVGWCLLLLVAAVQGCKKNEMEIPEAALQVESYYPNSGKGGALVTIIGQGFGNDIGKLVVNFGGKPAEVISAKGETVVVRSPADGISGPIAVIKGSTSLEIGTYTYQLLSVQSAHPLNGPAGSNITIRGEGFSSTAGPAKVAINGNEAQVVLVTDTLIVASVPEGSGKGKIEVNVDGETSAGPEFQYQAIYSIKPVSGGKGTRVTIQGEGFAPEKENNIVRFHGNVQATVVEATADQLVVMVPEGVETGVMSVTVNDVRTTGQLFTVVPPPTITEVSPLSGPGGTQMTIRGQQFSTILDENTVLINGHEIAVTAATANELKLVLPGGTGSGKVVVIVNDQPAEGPEFRDQTLGILQVSPESGLAGTQVTITGTGFSSNAAENSVTFNGVTATVMQATENSLTVIAPEGFTTGQLMVQVGGLSAWAPKTFNRAGVVTLAGGPGSNVLPMGMLRIAVDGNKQVYTVTRSQVWKISADGSQVTLLAGSPSAATGYEDGQGTNATFTNISGLVVDQQNNILVVDGGTRLRKITSGGTVTTLTTDLPFVSNLTIDAHGNLYMNRSFQGMVRYNTSGVQSTYITHAVYNDCRPAIDAAGTVYFSGDQFYSYLSMRVVAENRYVSQWAGTAGSGFADGAFNSALFATAIRALVFENENNLLIMDSGNLALRRARLDVQEITTVFKAERGYQDGSFADVQMSTITDMAIADDGDIYLLDGGNNAIRRVFLK